jgi:predicted transposase YbfD/YdcC
VIFFPQDPLAQKQRVARTEETNRGRLETRQLITREIQPAQLGLIGAAQVARLDKERADKGKTTSTQMWLTTSRSPQELPPLDFLTARRQEWGIENGLHYVLDVSGDEDRRLKSRTPNNICVLSLLSRVSVALWKRSRKNRQSYYQWREDQKSRCDWLLQLMRTAPAKVKW